MTFCRHFIKELFKASGKSAAETSSVMHSGDLQRSSPVPESGEEISSFHPGKCTSGSSCDHVILHRQPASLPGDICLTGRADPPAIAIIPVVRGQANRDLSHLTLSVFLFVTFSKRNERLSREMVV